MAAQRRDDSRPHKARRELRVMPQPRMTARGESEADGSNWPLWVGSFVRPDPYLSDRLCPSAPSYGTPSRERIGRRVELAAAMFERALTSERSLCGIQQIGSRDRLASVRGASWAGALARCKLAARRGGVHGRQAHGGANQGSTIA